MRHVSQLEPPDATVISQSFELFYAATMRRTLVAALQTTRDRDIAHRATQYAYAILFGQWHDLQTHSWPENARHVLALATQTAAASSCHPDSDPAADDDREQYVNDEFELHWAHIRDGLRELAATAHWPPPPDSDARFSAFVVGIDPELGAITGRLTQVGVDPVHEAATVDEAKACTRAGGPCDLALLDLDLPHGGGVEMVNHLRLQGWRRIMVLASPDKPATVLLAFRAGAHACLLKLAPHGNEQLQLVPDNTIRTDQRPYTHHNNNPHQLSNREIEVLQLVAAGHSNKEIGETLNLSAFTIRSHLMRIGHKFGTGNRAQMVAHAMRARIIR